MKGNRKNCFSLNRGIIGLWIGDNYFTIRAPWRAPLFSERYGYTPTVFRFFGWRILVRKSS